MSKIQTILDRATTVAELIEELMMCDPEAKVLFSSDYGDHVHTEQVMADYTLDELDDSEMLYTTGYSNSGVAVRELDGDEAGEELNAIVIRL